MIIQPSALFVAATALFAVSDAADGLSYNGLAVTPQLGWNNWYSHGCDVKEDSVLTSAKQIVKLGLRDMGYEYVVLDDCWSHGRDQDGKLVADSEKFPRGMKHVADTIHDMGLKFGMYSSAGRWTCAGYEGSLGNEDIDAQTWADWGVDYLKYDNCFNNGESGTPQISFNRYKAMSDALNKTGRPILYSMCNWGDDKPWDWASTIANSIRMSGDVYDSFDRPDRRCPCDGDEYYCELPGYHCSIMNVLNKYSAFPSKAQPGFWMDLDILQAGLGGSSFEEYKTQFSMWAIAKSPMIMGAVMDEITAETYQIFSNAAILAVNQDPAGSAANRVWRKYVDDKDKYGQGEISLWSGSLDNGDQVVALLNAGAKKRVMKAELADIFADSGSEGTAPQVSKSWDIYDLWGNALDINVAQDIISNKTSPHGHIYNTTELSFADGLKKNDPRLFGKKIGTVEPKGTIQAEVPSHGVALYRLREQSTKDEL